MGIKPRPVRGQRQQCAIGNSPGKTSRHQGVICPSAIPKAHRRGSERVWHLQPGAEACLEPSRDERNLNHAKVFSQIFDSSIADDFRLRHFFMDLLVLADLNGCVDMTPSAIAARTRIPLEEVQAMLTRLEQPDPESRTPDAEGRRIERLDDHRTWGWHIINYAKFRETASEAQRRENTRARVASFRQKRQQNPPCNAPVTLGNACNAMQKQKQKQMEMQKENEDVGQSVRPATAGRPRSAAVAAPASAEHIISELSQNPAYQGLRVDIEWHKMVAYCQTHRKQPSKRRFVNWLNRCDHPIAPTTKPPANSTF